MSRWLIRKHPDDVACMRWRVSSPDTHPDSFTGRPSWVEAMLCVAKLDQELNGAES